MPRNAKKSAEPENRLSSFASLLLGWTQQGIDSFLATQRILADFATRKTSGAIDSLREGMSGSENSPFAMLTELAVEGTASLTEAQRVLLNLVEQENGIVMGAMVDRVGGYGSAASVANRLRRGIDTLVEMQQELLTITSKHVQARLQKTQAGEMPDAACLLDATRDAMENFVGAQKKLLDIIVENGAKPKGNENKKKAEISSIAREAASSFIDAQKNLLDLAGQQVNVNLQVAGRLAEMASMFQMSPLPTITGDSVKSFVEAEKAVLDSIMKPSNGAKTAPKAERAAKRPARRRRAAAAQAAGA
ncbi:MAG: hypothetical protein ABSD96_04740 [Candidatus Korobacteraceae bacterium]|jgi:hypothetical protein